MVCSYLLPEVKDKSHLTDKTVNLIIDFLASLEDTFLSTEIVELCCFFVNFKQPEFQAEFFFQCCESRSSHL